MIPSQRTQRRFFFLHWLPPILWLWEIIWWDKPLKTQNSSGFDLLATFTSSTNQRRWSCTTSSLFFLRHRTNTTSSFLMSFAVNVLEYKDHPRNERGSYVKTNNADKLDFEIAIFLRLRYICICCSCHRAIHSFIYTWFVYVLIFTHISHHLDGCTFVLPIPCLTTVSFCYINLSSRQRSRLYRPSKELPLKQRFYIEANQNYMQCNNVEYMK